jgi:hypothetical protein
VVVLVRVVLLYLPLLMLPPQTLLALPLLYPLWVVVVYARRLARWVVVVVVPMLPLLPLPLLPL